MCFPPSSIRKSSRALIASIFLHLQVNYIDVTQHAVFAPKNLITERTVKTRRQCTMKSRLVEFETLLTCQNFRTARTRKLWPALSVHSYLVVASLLTSRESLRARFALELVRFIIMSSSKVALQVAHVLEALWALFAFSFGMCGHMSD